MEDPRRTSRGNHKHDLSDILLLVITSVLCGLSEWHDIELFGKLQIEWFRKHGSFKHGIPSHDTLSRVFSLLDPQQFGECFSKWIASIRHSEAGSLISIDGKRVRGAGNSTQGKNAVHIVSAYAHEQGLCLGQAITNDKANELEAISDLLKLLDIEGCIVSIDALGCQKEIAKTIVDKNADYLLALKENQPELYRQARESERYALKTMQYKQVDTGHGRVETRTCTVWDDIRLMDVASQWQSLKTIVKIEAERYNKSTRNTEHQTRYYITTLDADPEKLNKAVRNHWGIENSLHWVLDVVFKEDESRKRTGHQAKNFNIVYKTALTLLQQAETNKPVPIKRKRLMAMASVEFREKLLGF
jgi:predicted transposase YbfD/YdcC